MTPNNWLCKHFDIEKKGYVNLGDVITPIVSWVVVIVGVLIGVFVIGLTIFTIVPDTSIYDISSSTPPDIKQSILICAYGWWIIIKYIIIPAAIIVALAAGYIKLSEIKIAKCERKQEEEK